MGNRGAGNSEVDDVRRADLTDVLAGNLCVACGACTAADSTIQLRLHPDKLMYEPDGVGGADAAAVCPSVEVDYAALQAQLFPNAEMTPFGVVESIMLAQSTNRARNLRASSGGLIKELLLELLAIPEVDGVIALTHLEGLRFEPELVRQAEGIDRLPGSIYHSISFERALRLLEDNDGRFVLVAIPCQLEGIYNYVTKRRPELLERIYTTVGLICGWTYTHHALRAICSYAGVDFDQLTGVSYRGEGPVGPLRLSLADGTQHDIQRRNNPDYATAFDRSYNLPRCHLCVNHLNVLAEFVVGDAWLKRVAGTETGVSILMARTARAHRVFESMAADGRIRLAPSGEEDIVESQSRNFAYGDSAYDYARYLTRTGARPPLLRGPGMAQVRAGALEDPAGFHRQLWTKIAMQQRGDYRLLQLRKTIERMGGRRALRPDRLARRLLGKALALRSRPAVEPPPPPVEPFE
ncbi:MAG: Coenzyme F420 hydrogenase/dehydrogenase, beta subunit C-terminal domain [Myxococcales bacterium]|nr:Coenzyme F420 hydrogenase/dehydrogenase, beta subunit C-terminal domain [Myxococcales bacterium]